MELRRAIALVLMVAVGMAVADEDLAVGQPLQQSSQASLPPSCTTATNLAVSADVSGLPPDDCTCAQTNSSIPANERDWIVIRIPSQSLVRAVRVTGHSGLLDVLVGGRFDSSSDLDAFSLCARYSGADGVYLPCAQPVFGRFVALRATDVTSGIRVCGVQVMGQSGNLLKAGSQLNWTVVPEAGAEQQWRLVDGDETTCVSVSADSFQASNVSLRMTMLQPIGGELRVKVVFRGAMGNSSANPTSCSAPVDGRACALVRGDSSSLEFVCACAPQCRGSLQIALRSIPTGQTWQLCEIVAIANESAAVRAFDECKGPAAALGLSDSDGRFDDEAWMASSSHASCAAPSLAKLNHVSAFPAQEASAWCAATPVTSWVGLDLATLFTIRAVLVQGGGTASPSALAGAYVTSFGVRYGLGSTDWIPYTENGVAKVFQGPSHPSIPVLRSFGSSLIASRIRIDALTWTIHPCLRFELIGCKLVPEEWTSSLRQAISAASGIPNSRLQVSSIYGADLPKEKARLGSLVQCSMYGSWSPSNTNADQWIQFDLGETRTIQGTYWRARDISFSQYVISYSVQYARTATDPLTLYPTVLETGASNVATIFYNDLLQPFDAQLIRVVPNGYNGFKSIRMDLHVAPKSPTLIAAPVMGADVDQRYTALSGHGVYQYINQTLTYDQAQQYCASEGAHLAQVSSIDEWTALKSWLPRPSVGQVYLEHVAKGQVGRYMGCYVDAANRDIGPILEYPTSITVEKCTESCFNQHANKYAGLEFNECRCGDRLGSYGIRPDSDCTVSCNGNASQKCGSSWRISAYYKGSWMPNPHVEWTLKGCYASDPAAFVGSSTTNNSMSVETCITSCLSTGFYRYIGVQTTNTCICISAFPQSATISPNCSSPCSADPAQTCGGPSALSVFEITYRGESCIWISRQNGTPSGIPLKSISNSSSSATCLDQQTDYKMASVPSNETRHFICKKDKTPTLRPTGLWPLTAFHGFRDVSSNRQHGQPGSDVSTNAQGAFTTTKASIVYNKGAASFTTTDSSFVNIPLQWNIASLKAFTLLVEVFLANSSTILTFPAASSVYPLSVSLQGSALNVTLTRQRDLTTMTGSIPVVLNRWCLLAVTYSTVTGNSLVYVDGALLTTIAVGSGEQLLSPSSPSLRLGTLDATHRSFQGSLRCLQTFDRELLTFEMDNARLRCAPSTTQGLLGLWPLNGDLQNYVHPALAAAANQTQFVAGPRLRLNSRVRALKTSGTPSTALTIAGPLKVSGSYTVMLQVKVATVSGTLLQLQPNAAPPVVVSIAAGTNATVSRSGSQPLQAACSTGQGTHVALRLDAAATTLSLFCGGALAGSRVVAAAELSLLQSIASMQLATDIPASLSCLMLFERALTDLEIATYQQYCPFRPDDVYGRRSTPKRHCAEWFTSGYLDSGLYLVDPDGGHGPVEPFTVYCNLSDTSYGLRGAKVVRHLMATSLGASQLPSQIGYEARMDQLQALLSASSYCRQWITFRCVNTPINQGSTQTLRWSSRGGVAQSGWAGTPAGCPCSLLGQCAGGPTARCNCDVNDAVQREDGGWITDRSLLPVTSIALAVATPQGNVTLGDLICFA